MKLIYKVDDKPTFGKAVIFAIQQLLAIMAATLIVPVIVGHDMSPAAALFGAGVGTIVYLLFTKFKSPVFLGSSFAFLGSMSAAFAGGVSMSLGYLGLIIGAVFAGLVYVIIAIFVKLFGAGWVNKLMPPVIIGPTVALIGLSLAGNAVGDLQKGDFAETSVFVAIACGLITLIVTIICATYGKKMIRLIPFIIGMLAGYAAATVFTVIGNAASIDALKVIDFSIFNGLLVDGNVTLATFLQLPSFTFLTAFGGFSEINASYIGSIALAYIPVAFVAFAEHIADHKNISSIIETDLVNGKPGLHRSLFGDGFGSMAGAFFGGCPNTTYGESIGCVAITGNASVITILYAAIGAILISFLSPFVTFVNSIPACVMGGVCMALYGFIAVSGLKMLQKVNLEDNKNLFIISTILISGIGGLSLTFKNADGSVSITITTIAVALILGIIVRLIVSGAKDEVTESKEE